MVLRRCRCFNGKCYDRLAWKGEIDEPSSDKLEFQLRLPFQVTPDMGFYQVNLKDPSVVIVGKEEVIKTLKEDRNIDPEIKSRLFNINDLTAEQRAVLK